jgi:hypothetical protein
LIQPWLKSVPIQAKELDSVVEEDVTLEPGVPIPPNVLHRQVNAGQKSGTDGISPCNRL